VGNSDRGSDLKGAGYGRFNRTLRAWFFRGRPIEYHHCQTVPLLSPRMSSSLLMSSSTLWIGMHDLERSPFIGATRRALVDVERAPFLSDASRLSAARSNTCVPPLIRPYPSRIFFFQRHLPPPPPSRESICEYSVAKKHIGLAERKILVLEDRSYYIQNPPYMVSRHMLIMRIAATGTSFTPIPCHA
jgi:hypothetical protein